MVLIKNTTTDPLFQDIVPLDNDFIEGNSPQQTGVNPWDRDKWYPQIQYQEESLNNIALCGPGTPKLNWAKTLECKFQYTFILSLEETQHQWQTYTTQEHSHTFPFPITTSKQLRYRIQNRQLKPTYKALIKDEMNLQKQLLTESQKTGHLQQLLLNLKQDYQNQKQQRRNKHNKKHRNRKKRKRHFSSNSSSNSTSNNTSDSESSTS